MAIGSEVLLLLRQPGKGITPRRDDAHSQDPTLDSLGHCD